jgi:hypothetical protein
VRIVHRERQLEREARGHQRPDVADDVLAGIPLDHEFVVNAEQEIRLPRFEVLRDPKARDFQDVRRRSLDDRIETDVGLLRVDWAPSTEEGLRVPLLFDRTRYTRLCALHRRERLEVLIEEPLPLDDRDPEPRREFLRSHPVDDPEVDRLRRGALFVRDLVDRNVENHRRGHGVEIDPVADRLHQGLVLRDLREENHLDLRVIRVDHLPTFRTDERAPDEIRVPRRDVLEIRIRATHPTRAGAELSEVHRDATVEVLPDQVRDVGLVQLRERPRTDDDLRERVIDLFERVLRRIRERDLLALEVLEDLLRRSDVHLVGFRERFEFLDPLFQFHPETDEVIEIDRDARLFHPEDHAH